MSPSPAAPSSASTIACVSTSASEWPARPRSPGISTPPRISGRPSAKRWVSMPIPAAHAQPIGSSRRSRPSNTQISVDADLLEQLERVLVAEAELVRRVGVARQRDRQPGADRLLEEAARRVDLGDRLAQPGGRDLDGHAAVEEALDGGLVVAPQVAARDRRVAAPHLHQVGVGHDVEHPGAGRLADRLEVALPHLLRRLAAPPHAEVLHVDRLVGDEVDGADDVVPLAGVEEVGEPVLAAGDEVGLDPEPQVGLLAHELAVGVDVVARPLLPPRVLPDVERLGEAVDVLRDAELGDPALLGDGAVALGVGGREVLARRASRRRRGAGGRGSR